MKHFVLLGLLLVTCLQASHAAPASAADCHPSVSALSATAHGGHGAFAGTVLSGGGTECSTSSAAPTSAAVPTMPPGKYVTDTACNVAIQNAGGPINCALYFTCPDGSAAQETYYQADSGARSDAHIYCKGGPSSSSTPVPIDPATELKTVPLPASTLHFQPADNRTLVHFKSNFYADGAPFDTTVKPLGHTMEFKGTATQFIWTFGDGSTLTTSNAGAPYPNLLVTHEYGKKGIVKAHVDTVYSASYSLDGGPWTPVAGTATSTGADVTITVLEATPVLTD